MLTRSCTLIRSCTLNKSNTVCLLKYCHLLLEENNIYSTTLSDVFSYRIIPGTVAYLGGGLKGSLVTCCATT